jgi:hypothetical protein
MAYLAKFQLGVPGNLYNFFLNPAVYMGSDEALADVTRALSTKVNKVTLGRHLPSVAIQGNYMTVENLNWLRSLLVVDWTSLVFRPLDLTGSFVLEVWQEFAKPTDVSTIYLPECSVLRGSKLEVDAGGSSQVSIVGVWSTRGNYRTGGGTNFYVSNGGSYDDSNYKISFSSPMPDANAKYVTFKYGAWAVTITAVPFRTDGGYTDRFKYETIELIPA